MCFADLFALVASQARQRSTGSDPIGLASEATLHGFRPYRPRKRGSAPRIPTLSASHLSSIALASDGARQRSRLPEMVVAAPAKYFSFLGR